MLEEIKSKQLNMTELFSIAAKVYQQNFKTIFFVSFFVFIPLFIIQYFVLSIAMDHLGSFFYMADSLLSVDSLLESRYYINYLIYMIVLLLIEWVVQPLATVTMIYGALNIVKGEKKSVKENFLYGFLKVPAVVWVNFLVGIYIFFISLGGLLLLQIFGGSIIGLALLLAMLIAVVYMTTIWYFTDHVVTIQQMSGFDALEMSKRVVQNYFKQTLGYIALFVVLTGMVNFVLEKGLDILYYAASYYIYIIGSIVFNFIVTVTITGFFCMFMTILFLNRIWGPVHASAAEQNSVMPLQETTAKPKEEAMKVNLEKSETKEDTEKVNFEKQKVIIENTPQCESTEITEHTPHSEPTAEGITENISQCESTEITEHTPHSEPTAEGTTENISQCESTAKEITEYTPHSEPTAEGITENISQCESTEITEHTPYSEPTAEGITENISQCESTEIREYTPHSEPTAEGTTENISQCESTAKEIREYTPHSEPTAEGITENISQCESTEITEHTPHSEPTTKGTTENTTHSEEKNN